MPLPSHLFLKRDPQGRIVEHTIRLGDSIEVRRYAYDAAGRLSRVTDGPGALRESYQYDQQGRRLADICPELRRGERRYTYGTGNRLGQTGSVQYGHDKAGFRNLKVVGDAETHYRYEPSGLLMHIDLPDGRHIQYLYDKSGQRTEKRVNGQVVAAYRWLDPLRLSEFHDGREWWRLAYWEGRTPVGLTNGEDSYFLLCDQIGTPLALATVDGNVVQAMQYDSFGNLLSQQGNVVRLPLGFAGGLHDQDTGLTRFVWRDYDADTGRFTALDPLREKGGDKDWYGYCVDDPVNRVDVWGLEVQFCKRPVKSDVLENFLDHHWLKTDSTEAGLKKETEGGLFSGSSWGDHTGQSELPNAECWPVPNVDEACVDKLIRPGTDIGTYFPGANDCQTNVREVLDSCRTDVE
jgi:RHS repeat-associated protein